MPGLFSFSTLCSSESGTALRGRFRVSQEKNMPPSPSPLVSLPWPVLVVGTFLATILVIALLLYAIARAAINKADARDLPNVLAEIGQMIRSIIRPLHRALHAAQLPSNAGAPMSAQGVGTLEQTGGQGTGETGAAQ
ncbi:hypothetical protein ABT061_24900 [Streptosporangium sp. NPDC002544]|uniref:hypothetical protein n=1 Tax=Streptosporangium sp. NPDC002544 TaxID=3154538 RepID=UPI00332CA6D4